MSLKHFNSLFEGFKVESKSVGCIESKSVSQCLGCIYDFGKGCADLFFESLDEIVYFKKQRPLSFTPPLLFCWRCSYFGREFGIASMKQENFIYLAFIFFLFRRLCIDMIEHPHFHFWHGKYGKQVWCGHVGTHGCVSNSALWEVLVRFKILRN